MKMAKYFGLPVILCTCLFHLACQRSTQPLVSDNRDTHTLFCDLQDGFSTDSVSVMIDSFTFFSDTITSDPHTGLAKRLQFGPQDGMHSFSLISSGNNIRFDTTLAFSDDLIIGVLQDTVSNRFVVSMYDKLPQYPYYELKDMDHVDIQFKDALAYADFMPPVLPDPLRIRIDLSVRNNFQYKIISGLQFTGAEVYLDSADLFLGKIRFSPYWDDFLLPGETDTVELYKVPLDSIPFPAPCKEHIYFKIEIKDKYQNNMIIKTSPVLFECTA